jgi:DNA-binding transcriptional regulator YiaG
VITGLKCRRSLYDSADPWHRVRAMTALRELRRATDLSQQAFAALMDVPVNTFRMWDSGLRPVPQDMLHRATVAATEHTRNSEPISLDQLAREFGVHQRTLRAAARTGRLQVTFSVRSVFGRPMRLATRAACQAFLRKDYRRFSGQSAAVAPLTSVPRDFDNRLRRLRRQLRLTQEGLAHRLGAASKAVVYQWESRKRTPSPVFWRRVERLGGAPSDGPPVRVAPKRPTAKAVSGLLREAPYPEHSADR